MVRCVICGWDVVDHPAHLGMVTWPWWYWYWDWVENRWSWYWDMHNVEEAHHACKWWYRTQHYRGA